MKIKLQLIFGITVASLSFQVFATYEDSQNGICLAYTQYLNKKDTQTIKNSRFNQKFQPRLNDALNKVGSCMKGKADTPQQFKNCMASTLSKADYDFLEGWNLGYYGIEISEPNMNEIKSKFRTSCNTIVN